MRQIPRDMKAAAHIQTQTLSDWYHGGRLLVLWSGAQVDRCFIFATFDQSVARPWHHRCHASLCTFVLTGLHYYSWQKASLFSLWTFHLPVSLSITRRQHAGTAEAVIGFHVKAVWTLTEISVSNLNFCSLLDVKLVSSAFCCLRVVEAQAFLCLLCHCTCFLYLAFPWISPGFNTCLKLNLQLL